MTYTKENGTYSYTDKDGKVLFSTPNLALLTNKGVVVGHGPVNIIKQKYIQNMNSGSQFSVIESTEFDVKDLNNKTANIQPTLQ